ncbi:hypothetical protein ACC691_39925, partial [Rhizobium johnstonii]|uniref:hypothetical protein n=1 Tax=Rhizobium johnstonii TaxID=3019933 RepID=UPI003F9C8AF0
SYPPADVTVPTVAVTASPAAPNGSNGWYKTRVTLTITGTDEYAPAPSLQASVDGAAWAAVTAPLTLGDGVHSVVVRSVDDTGNV